MASVKERRWPEPKNSGLPPASVTMSEFALRSLGQVAQLVERSPEKAGVGGSSPSLATTPKVPTVIDLQALFSGLGPPERASAESKWSPNSTRLRSW